MRKRKLISIMLVLTMMFTMMAPIAYAIPAATPSISLASSNANPQPGDTFTVDINVADVEKLFTASVYLTFDPTKLEVVDGITSGVSGINLIPGTVISEDQFIPTGDGNVTYPDNKANNTTGTIAYSVGFLGDPGVDVTPFTGSGKLATIIFKAKSGVNGTTDVQFTDNSPSVPNGVLFAKAGGIQISSVTVNNISIIIGKNYGTVIALPDSGTYSKDKNVELERYTMLPSDPHATPDTDPNYAIQYRLNGTGDWQTYTNPIHVVDDGTIINARVVYVPDTAYVSSEFTFTYHFDQTYQSVREGMTILKKMAALNNDQLAFLADKMGELDSVTGFVSGEFDPLSVVLTGYFVNKVAEFRAAVDGDNYSYLVDFLNAVKTAIPQRIKIGIASQGVSQEDLILVALDIMSAGLNLMAVDPVEVSEVKAGIDQILTENGIFGAKPALSALGFTFAHWQEFLNNMNTDERNELKDIIKFLSTVFIKSVAITGDDVVNILPSGSNTADYTAQVKDQFGDAMSGESVTWSLNATYPGVALSSAGKLTVDSSAQNNTIVEIRATSNTDNTKIGTKTVTLQRETAVATTLELSGADSITILPSTDVKETYTATVKDQYGETMTGQTIVWSINPTVTGVTVDNNGVVTVAKGTANGSFNVKAEVGSLTQSITVNMTRQTAVATTLELSGADSITILPSANATETYTAMVKDQYGATMPGQTITLSIDPTVNGVSISNGIVTVAQGAAEGSFNLIAQAGSLTQNKTVYMTRQTAAATTLELSGADSITILPNENNTSQYTAVIKDQYGTVMTGQSVNWSIDPAVSGVSVANGLVTVNKGLANGSFTLKVVAGNLNQTKSVTIQREAPQATSITIAGKSSLTIPSSVKTTSPYSAVVMDQYGVVMLGQTLNWTVDGTPQGVSVDTGGNLSIETNTAPGNITLRAVSGSAVQTRVISLARETSVITTVEISGDSSATIPATGDTQKVYSAVVKDQYGTPMTTGVSVSWAIDPAVTGVSVSGGTVTITNLASLGTFNLKATSGTKTGTKTVTLAREVSVVTSIEVSGTDNVFIPATGNNTAVYTAKVLDQYGNEMTGETVNWSLEFAPSGVTFEAVTRTLTVPSTATEEEVCVKAESNSTPSVHGVKILWVTKANPVVTSLEITGGNTVLLPATGNSSSNYTAVVKDQYGVEMTGQTVTWSLTSAVTGVSINNGEVTVGSNAVAGTSFTVEASCEGKTATKTVKVEKAASSATTVEVSGTTPLIIPASGNNTSTYTAVVKDQYGQVMTGQAVTWALAAPLTGVSVNQTTGVVTVSSLSVPNTSFTLNAASSSATGSIRVSLARATSVLTSIDINGADTITIPAANTATGTYSAVAKDQYGVLMTGQSVTWSLVAPPTGVSINSTTGEVTVVSGTIPGMFTIKAVNGLVSKSKTITLVRAASQATSIEISGAGNIQIPATGSQTAGYTAIVKDQYGVTLSGQTISWSLETPVTGVTVNSSTGTVTVGTVTEIGTCTIKAQVGTNVSQTKAVSLTKAPSVVTSIIVEGSDSVNVPAAGSGNATYTATVKDQYGTVMTGETITWAIDPAVTGISVNNGVVTINGPVNAGSFIIKASNNGVTGTKTVNLNSAVVSVELSAKKFDGSTKSADSSIYYLKAGEQLIIDVTLSADQASGLTAYVGNGPWKIVSVDSNGFVRQSAGTYRWTYTVGAGDTLTASAVKAFTTINEKTATTRIALDNVAQIISVLSPQNNKLLGANTNVSVTALTEATTRTAIFNINNQSITLNKLRDGMYTGTYNTANNSGAFTGSVTIEDFAGNTKTLGNAVQITVDSQAPVINSVTNGAHASYKEGDAIVITVNTQDLGAAGIESVLVDIGTVHTNLVAVSKGNNNYEASWTVPAGVNAQNVTVTARVKDKVGNQASDTLSSTITLDTVKPVSSYSINPATPNGLNNWYIKNSPVLNVTLNEAGAIHYQINGGTEQVTGNTASITIPDGEINVTYWGVDTAGNVEAVQQVKSFKADTVVPTITLESVSNVNTTTATGTLSGNTGTEGNLKVEMYRINPSGSASLISVPGFTSAGDGTFSMEARLNQGENKFRAIAWDAAGNAALSGTVTRVFDNKGPVFNIVVDEAPDVDGLRNITVEADELVDSAFHYELSVNGSVYGDFTMTQIAPKKWSGIFPVGSRFDFVIEGKDGFGNRGIGIYTRTSVVASAGLDYTNEDIVIFIPGGALGADTDILAGDTFENTDKLVEEGTDFARAVNFRPDGTQFSQPVRITIPYDSSITDINKIRVFYYNLTDPSNPYWEDFTDKIVENGIDETNHTVTFETDHFSDYSSASDTTPPELVVTGPTDNLITKNMTVDVAGTTESNLNGIEVSIKVNGTSAGSITTTDGSYQFSNVSLTADQNNSIVVTAKDMANNETQRTVNVIQDSTKPVINITSPVANFRTKSGNVTVSGTVTEVNLHQVHVNGTMVPVDGTGGFSATVAINSEGTNTITVEAADKAGNNGTSTVSVVKDSTALITVTAPVNGAYTGDTVVAVTGTTDDASADITVINQTTGVTFTGQSVLGAFTVNVNLSLDAVNQLLAYAVDDLGNTSSNVTWSVTQDTSEPDLIIVQPAGAVTTANSQYNISGKVISNLDILEATWSMGSGSHLITVDNSGDFSFTVDLSEGDNVITVRAVNANGSDSETVTITKDSNGPAISITSHTNNQNLESQLAILQGTLSEPGTITISYGNTSVTENVYAGALDFSVELALSIGENPITITAIDETGNDGSIPLTLIVRAPSRLDELELGGTIGTITVGNTFDLSTLTLSGKSQHGEAFSFDSSAVVWLSSDVNTADISGNTLTAKAAGTTYITAQIGDITSINSILATFQAPSSPGGGGGAPPDTTTVTVNDADVTKQLASGNKEITVTVPKGTETVVINAQTFNKISEAGKDLVVKTDKVAFRIPADTFAVSGTGKINLKVEELSSSAADKIAPKGESDLKAVGQVFEITSSVAPKKGIQVTISYEGMNLTGVDEDNLDVYWYDEAKETWVAMKGTVDKVNNTVTFVATHFSKYAVMEFKGSFADIAGHWAKADIEMMVSKGVIKGISSTEFAPNAQITRAQFAALLVRALGIAPEPEYQLPFGDVSANQWYYGEVAAAYHVGIIKGISDSVFAPNANITREQMAAMMARAMEIAGKGMEMTQAQADAQLASYQDGSQIAGWAKVDVAKAMSMGIIKGRTADTFVPKANATRAESAVMIKRMFVQLY